VVAIVHNSYYADPSDAKRILTEAIAMDTKFLAAQSVMDYSLLLGLDKGQKELVVGIVDSIGSYDLWKTIESKGKMLTRSGEVTVVSLLLPWTPNELIP
jgi:1-phosphatidylinositol-3-phosphate 5-kinase